MIFRSHTLVVLYSVTQIWTRWSSCRYHASGRWVRIEPRDSAQSVPSVCNELVRGTAPEDLGSDRYCRRSLDAMIRVRP